MNLARPFVRRPVASALLAVALVLLGLLSYRLLPVAAMPQVEFPVISVRASLPGASPETMANRVAAPLERALGSIAGVTTLNSSSNQGSTSVTLEFELGRDIHAAARDVQAALNAAQPDLPSGMPSPPSFRKVDPSQSPILVLALSSPNLQPGVLYDAAATLLAQRLSQISGVGEVTVGGSSLPAVRLQLDPRALDHYGIALDDVRNAVGLASAIAPQGAIESDTLHWRVQGSDQLRTAAEYRTLIVRHQGDATVRLGDVARVTDSVENRYSSGYHNENPAVMLMVNRQSGANLIATVDAIHAQLPALRALLPGDAQLAVVLDRSPVIRATLQEARNTLLLSCLLVSLVVLLFLGRWQAALIPTLAIPVSLIGAFPVMYLAGFSLNNLSLMALIVAAGLVVDDAIVVLENIQRHLRTGLSPMRAAVRGAGEVGFTLFAMNLALMTVFVSILFMGGVVERLFREFSLTLVATMVVSLVVSLTLTPSLCARWLPRADAEVPPGRLLRFGTRLFADVQAGYGRGLDWMLRHLALAILSLMAVIGLNAYLYVELPKGFLPEQDSGQLRGFVRGDDGFSFQVMQPKIDTYRQLLLADPAVADVVSTSGGSGGTSNAGLLIRLKPLAERGVHATEVIRRLRAQLPPVPGASLFLGLPQDIEMPHMSSSGSHDLMLLSDDLSLIRTWAPRVATALAQVPELAEVEPISDGGTVQVQLTIDREAAARLGVDVRTITAVLNNAFSQRQIATLYDEMNQYRVVMELLPEYTQEPSVLDQVELIGASGQRVPLSAVAHYDYHLVDDRVRHRQQFAAENIGFSLAEGVAMNEALQAIDAAMESIHLPSSVMTMLAGEAGSFLNTTKAQPMLLLAVVVIVYLVLGILYESLLHPLTILSTVPSAGLGALLALKLTGTEFSLIALLGLFLLIGIVMKNAILMIDVALARQRQDGLSAFEAIRSAALVRLRPILMTNLAALLGALPLLMAFGEGVEMRRPLGLAIVGGLVVSQLLTLFTVPAVYLWLDRLAEPLRARRRRRAERMAAQTG